MRLAIFFIIVAGLSIHCNALKAKWTPNGAKPAPYSAKYRKKHNIKTPGEDYQPQTDPPSNTKMLLFFGGCIGMYILWSRSQQPYTRSDNTAGRANTRGSSSSSFAMPGVVSHSPRTNRFIDDSTSSTSSSAAQEARLARLKRFSEAGETKNKQAMQDALNADSNRKSENSGPTTLRKRGTSGRSGKKMGTIHSLDSNRDGVSRDKNTYDGGNSTMFEGSDDQK